MNNQFARNQYNNNEQPSLVQLKNILMGIHEIACKEQQRSLMTMIDHLQKIMIKKFAENPTQVRPRDYNLSTAIYEKCLLIKNRNEELKIKVLNLRASLSKIMSNSKQSSPHQRAYADIMDNIRKRGVDVKAKIEKYRGNTFGVPRLTNHELLRSKGVMELKKGTQWLERKTLEIKKEVEVWREYCINQTSYRD